MSASVATRHDGRKAMLAWAAGLGAVTAEALSVRDEASVAAARSRLAAAARAGLLHRSAPLRARPALYTVTRGGLRACGEPDLAPARVTAANAAHAAACAIVAAELARRFPGRAILGEPVLRRLECSSSGALSCRLGHRGGGGCEALHRPDLALVEESSMPVVVEVELTVKAPVRLQQICLAWARCRSVAGVIYVAGEAAERAVTRAIERTAAGASVLVLPLEAVTAGPV
jgi:hypothetical protein